MSKGWKNGICLVCLGEEEKGRVTTFRFVKKCLKRNRIDCFPSPGGIRLGNQNNFSALWAVRCPCPLQTECFLQKFRKPRQSKAPNSAGLGATRKAHYIIPVCKNQMRRLPEWIPHLVLARYQVNLEKWWMKATLYCGSSETTNPGQIASCGGNISPWMSFCEGERKEA